MANIVTSSEVMTLCRPISGHYEPARIDMFIPEAELLDVKDQIGEQLYISILEEAGTTYNEFLTGGVYEVADKKYIFKGLKSAIAYFVYCRLIKNSDGQLTRFGFVAKDTDVSTRPDLRERTAAANEAFEIGKAYLNECLQYIRLVIEPTNQCTITQVKSTTYRINAIGD
jgi:hypothetical protein